jgi:hypothetical protein
MAKNKIDLVLDGFDSLLPDQFNKTYTHLARESAFFYQVPSSQDLNLIQLQ